MYAFFDAPGDSDHSPCVVDLNVNLRSRKCSFKYFSFLAMHPKFLETIKSAWDEDIPVGSKLFSLGQKLSHVKKACRKLNKEGFGNIQQRARMLFRSCRISNLVYYSTHRQPIPRRVCSQKGMEVF